MLTSNAPNRNFDSGVLKRDVMKTLSPITAAPRTAAVKDAGPKLVGVRVLSSANAGDTPTPWPTNSDAPVRQLPARNARRLRGIAVSVG
ncbi:hypothetical protein GCM10010404_70980 [Nonomuraea africana]